MFITLLFLISASAWSADTLKPFELVSSESADLAGVVDTTKNKLTSGGFMLAGEYSPYDGAHVLVVTSDELQAAAAETDAGGYGSVIRVAVTKNADMVEVTYSNPVYWAKAYRLPGDMTAVANKMTAAQRLFRGVGLAVAFAGIAFLVSDYLEAHGSLRLLTPQQSVELSSFVSEASVSKGYPPVLFAHVDDSWELLSTESRQQEAEALFKGASARWGTRDGFIHRGKALVAQHFDNEVTVFGSIHGDTK